MKKLMLFKIIVVFVHLIVATISIITLYGVLSGGVSIHLPEEDDVHIKVVDNVLYITAPTSIRNEGIFSITKVHVDMCIENGTYTIAGCDHYISKIGTHYTYTKDFGISINLTQLYKDNVTRLLTENATITVKVAVSAYASLELVRFTSYYEEDMKWTAPIAVCVHKENISAAYLPEGITLKIPYSVQTSSWLKNNVSATLTVKDMNAILAQGTNTFQMGGLHEDCFTLHFDTDASEELMTQDKNLSLCLNLDVEGIDVDVNYTYNYDWGAPLSNLKFSNMHYEANMMSLTYTFMNHGAADINATIDIAAYNISGDMVGRACTMLMAATGEAVNNTISIATSEQVSYIIVQIVDETLGIEYEVLRYA